MKRYIAILVLLFAVLFVFTACGNGNVEKYAEINFNNLQEFDEWIEIDTYDFDNGIVYSSNVAYTYKFYDGFVDKARMQNGKFTNYDPQRMNIYSKSDDMISFFNSGEWYLLDKEVHSKGVVLITEGFGSSDRMMFPVELIDWSRSPEYIQNPDAEYECAFYIK